MPRGTSEIKLKGREDNRCVISGFRRKVDENCTLLGYDAANSGNSLSTFRDNLSVPSSSVKNSRRRRWDRKVVPKHRQGITTTHCVIVQKSAVLRKANVWDQI
jgi:hypothetical protein